MKRTLIVIILIVVSIKGIAQPIEKKIDSLLIRAEYAKAIQLINSYPTKSVALQNKEAEALMSSGKFNEAEAVLSKLNSDDPINKAITQTNLGYLNLLKGRNDLAQENLEQARDGFKQIGKDKTKEAARCFSNLSLVYWSSGKFSQAEENGLLALQLRQSIFGTESEEAAASMNDLGLVYGSTDANKGLDYYEKVLGIYEKFYGEDHPKIAIAKTNIGLMYFNLKLYGDAVVNFESSQAIWEKTYPNGHPNEAISLINLGRTYTQMKNTKAALEYYEKALMIYKKSYGEKHPDIAVVYNQTGYIKLEDNKYEVALTDFQNALCANSPTFNELSTRKNPDIRNFYNGKVLLFSFRLKAQAFESLHYGKTLKLQDLKFALQTLQSCDSLIDNIRHNSSNENDKIELGSLANEVYEDGVRIAYAISELTPNSQSYRETAFYFAEKSKSAVLQESIADAQAKSFAGIPLELIEEEQNKKTTIAFLSQRLSEKPNPEEEKSLRSLLFNTNIEYQQFIKKLETDYPAYYNLKYSSATPSVADVQKIVLPLQAVVSYFIADKNKKLYQFVITQKKFKITSRSLPENFDRSCKGFINSLLYSDFKTYKNSYSLAKLLKPNVPKSVKSIVVIPSGKIGSLPLEAMPLKITDDGFNGSSFFIDRWAISYEFAAGLMLQKAKDKRDKKSSGIFLCAPIHFTENQSLSDLLGTEKEVNAIAELFPNQSKISTNADANETTLKSKEIKNYTYLHLATHGIVDSSDPSLSQIFLNGSETEDGNLFCKEIYNMNMGSDLVVLSACETGLGKFSKGEGVIGLSRALTYAGAKNIIVSFWKVSDESTAELMISFYKHLIENKDQNFSKAIRQAKVDIIKTGKYSSPYYWAPFVLIGK
jgi:CHAT domain-containing protein/Tfp pilus assembly protein PilF